MFTVRAKVLCLTIVAVCMTQASSAETPLIMVLAPQGAVFEQATDGLTEELNGSFVVTSVTFDSGFTAAELDKRIVAVSPRAIVIMGNKPIRLYKEYVDVVRKKKNGIPTVALLASQMEKAIEGLDNVQGIAYETPMVTAVTDFRNVIGKPIGKIGVVYRGVFEPFVKKHTEFCKREKIEVASILIGNEPKSHGREIEKALQQLIRKDKVEAFWIPNDNILLKPVLLGEVWIPMFTKNSLPVIVGVESLVQPALNFGTFAVIPDPKALGEQAAQQCARLENENWKFDAHVVYPAISVYSVLNLKKTLAVADIANINTREVTKVLDGEK